VTLEIEQIATAVIDAAASFGPTRPGASVVHMVQDRARQKLWLQSNGFPVGPYTVVQSLDDVRAALRKFPSAFVKACHGGYDGRGQARTNGSSRADDVWDAIGKGAAVAEQALDLAGELSVMIARRPGGDVAVFPVALNHHERQALSWSMTPPPLPKSLMDQAVEIARGIATTIGLEGLLAVEFFLTAEGVVLVNELAPRPHNSGHYTKRACVSSQFEQLTRAVCDLPLGGTDIVTPAAIVNIFGDLWVDHPTPDFSRALETPGVRLHLYGKSGARRGRKMGHLSAVGRTAVEALGAAREAASMIGVNTEPIPASLASFGVRP